MLTITTTCSLRYEKILNPVRSQQSSYRDPRGPWSLFDHRDFLTNFDKRGFNLRLKQYIGYSLQGHGQNFISKFALRVLFWGIVYCV